MRQRKHTKQWELQAEVNNAVRICKTREEHKKKEREKEGTNIFWLESYRVFGAKGEWKAWKGISTCNLQTLAYFHAQHLSHLVNK